MSTSVSQVDFTLTTPDLHLLSFLGGQEPPLGQVLDVFEPQCGAGDVTGRDMVKVKVDRGEYFYIRKWLVGSKESQRKIERYDPRRFSTQAIGLKWDTAAARFDDEYRHSRVRKI